MEQPTQRYQVTSATAHSEKRRIKAAIPTLGFFTIALRQLRLQAGVIKLHYTHWDLDFANIRSVHLPTMAKSSDTLSTLPPPYASLPTVTESERLLDRLETTIRAEQATSDAAVTEAARLRSFLLYTLSIDYQHLSGVSLSAEDREHFAQLQNNMQDWRTTYGQPRLTITERAQLGPYPTSGSSSTNRAKRWRSPLTARWPPFCALPSTKRNLACTKVLFSGYCILWGSRLWPIKSI